MAARYFLVDTSRIPRDKVPGRKTFPSGSVAGRFNSLPHALRELKATVTWGNGDTFMLYDRVTGTEVKPTSTGGAK
jgi:hypothetical protein